MKDEKDICAESRDYLNQLYYEHREIRHLQDVLKELRLSPLLGTLTPSDDVRVQTSKRLDPMGDAVTSAADLEGAIGDRIIALRRHKLAAAALISHVPDATLRSVLILRYLKLTKDDRRPTWDAIADDMGYDVRHVLKLHRRALDAFCDVYSRA